MTILCVLETQVKGFGAKNLTRKNGKNHLLHYSGNLSKSVKVVCAMIKLKRQADFGKNKQNDDEIR